MVYILVFKKGMHAQSLSRVWLFVTRWTVFLKRKTGNENLERSEKEASQADLIFHSNLS